MEIRRLAIALTLAVAPSVCFASDPTGMFFLVTIPALLVSLLIAYVIAYSSKTGLGYAGLSLLAVLNLAPGVSLTQELIGHGSDVIAGIAHGAAYCLLLPPFYILHKRLSLSKPRKPERHW